MTLKALIFDLDGVITDTAEYHFLAWQQLAHELGIDFTRADNEQLRGVSRRDSLLFILNLQVTATDQLPLPDAEIERLMARKNANYVSMLEQVSPDDLLPGVLALLDALDSADIRYCIGSASKNAPNVVKRLGIADRMQFVAHGGLVERSKPAPDLFLYSAEKLGVAPQDCLVVEDAAAGIQAAIAANMAAIALGPVERFGNLLDAPRVMQCASLVGVTVQELRNL